MNPYHVLGVSPHADSAALQAAYRKLVRLHHPDLARDEAAWRAASERMVRINWAWHILSDVGRRAAFDAQFRAQQFEAARRQQAAFRAQAQDQVMRGTQAHLNDVLNAQAQRRQQENRERQQQNQAQESEQQFLEWQALERARQEHETREARAKSGVTRPIRQHETREEKKRQALARACLRRMRREDQKRSSAPSARHQLAEAARLFGQEGRAGDAIAICHDVLRVDFRNVPARELLGDFYLRLGREDRALPLWEQALALQPGNAAVRHKLNSLRPHDLKSYHPRVSRSATARQAAATSPRPAHGGFWGRLCDALRSGL